MKKESVNKVRFTVKVKEDEQEKELELAVERPSPELQLKAQMKYNAAYRAAIESGAYIRAKVDDIVKEQNLVSEADKTEQDRLQAQIVKNLKLIKAGGVKLKDAVVAAIEVRKLRRKIRETMGKRTTVDVNTADGQAEQERFNFLVSKCLIWDESGKPYYNSVEEYLDAANAGDEIANTGASKFAFLWNNFDEDYEKKLPENKFLRRFNLVDDENFLLDDKKRRTDDEGRHVDKDARYIKWFGDGPDDFYYVDIKGNRVDKEGEYLADEEFKPFLDDEGNPIVEQSEPSPANKENEI